jgi:hypothetical protein
LPNHFSHCIFHQKKQLKIIAMAQTLRGTWYNDIQLDCNYPEIADVSAAHYTAKIFKGNLLTEEQRPFMICHHEPVTLKVEPWLGEALTFKFPAGPYPMRIRRILHDAGNTATSIQIAY